MWLGHHFQGQRSRSPGHFTHRSINAAAAVSVGMYWPWEPTATLPSAFCRCGRLGGARCFGAHRGRRGAGAYCGGRPPTACCYRIFSFCFMLWSVKLINKISLAFLTLFVWSLSPARTTNYCCWTHLTLCLKLYSHLCYFVIVPNWQ